MIIKVMIKTPKGTATVNEKRVRQFILGTRRSRIKIINKYVDADDSTFIWEIEGPVKDILRIQKNVSRFDMVMRMVLDHKLMKKTLRKKLSEQGEAELKELLNDQTTVEIIKSADAAELVSANMTFWERVLKTFKKV